MPVIKVYKAGEVAAIRKRRQLSQSEFAVYLGVNVKTLQSWEQGVRMPSKPTMRLLQVFDDPEAFRQVLDVSLPQPKKAKV